MGIGFVRFLLRVGARREGSLHFTIGGGVVTGSWWKSTPKNGCATRAEERIHGGTPPRFFVSVAAKGVSFVASRLFAILAGDSISVADKGLRGARCWREGNGLGWQDFEGD